MCPSKRDKNIKKYICEVQLSNRINYLAIRIYDMSRETSFCSAKHARRALSNTEFLSIPTALGKERKDGVPIDERNDEEEMWKV